MAATCLETNYYARCHHTCNGLIANQSQHAKSRGCTIMQKCSQQFTGTTEIVIQPSSVFEVPTCTSAADKSCSLCNNPIRSCFADLAYHCEDPSCVNVCRHLTCSGFTIPRGPARVQALSTRIWHCQLYSSLTAGGLSSIQQHPSLVRLTPPSLNSLLNQIMSLASVSLAKCSKQKYAECFATHSNTVPVKCSACNKGFLKNSVLVRKHQIAITN